MEMKSLFLVAAGAALLGAGCEKEEFARYDRLSYPYPVYAGGSSAADDSATVQTGRGESSAPVTVAAPGTSPAAAAGVSIGSAPPAGPNLVTITQIRELLQRDPELALSSPNIQIEEQNGGIVVAGFVPDEAQLQRIESILAQFKQVEIRNDLQVNVVSAAGGATAVSVSNAAPATAVAGAGDSSTSAASPAPAAPPVSGVAATSPATNSPLPTAAAATTNAVYGGTLDTSGTVSGSGSTTNLVTPGIPGPTNSPLPLPGQTNTDTNTLPTLPPAPPPGSPPASPNPENAK